MKKVLFATTALVASAGVASAQGVTTTGSAEMGIYGGSGIETQFFQDIDVTFTMSGETDNGLTFGAAVDLDEAQDTCTVAALPTTCGNHALDDVTEDGGVAIFISGDFGTLTMGDTDGALDWALTEAAVGNPGSIADDETAHSGYLGAYIDGAYDGQIVRYDNTFGDFGVALSVEMDETGARDAGFAIGFRYGFDIGGGSVDLGVGYQSAVYATGADIRVLGVLAADTDTDALGASIAVNLDSGFTAALQYSQMDFGAAGDLTHYGIGAGYSWDAFSIHANYGMLDGSNGLSESGWGLAAGYDLGGGASLLAGYGQSESTAGVSTDSFSLGVSMSF